VTHRSTFRRQGFAQPPVISSIKGRRLDWLLDDPSAMAILPVLCFVTERLCYTLRKRKTGMPTDGVSPVNNGGYVLLADPTAD